MRGLLGEQLWPVAVRRTDSRVCMEYVDREHTDLGAMPPAARLLQPRNPDTSVGIVMRVRD